MNHDVVKRLVSAGSGNAASQALLALSQLILPPAFLVAWGSERYGTWLIVTAIPTFLAWSDLGLGTTLATALVLARARGEEDRARELFQTGILVQGVIATLGLIACTGLVACWPPATGIGPIPEEHRFTFWALSAYTLVAMATSTWAGGYRAHLKYSRLLVWQNLTKVFELIAIFSCLATKLGEGTIALTMLANRVVWIAVIAWDYGRIPGRTPAGIRDARFTHVMGLIKPAFAQLTMPIGQSLSLQAVVIIVGAYAGPAAAAALGTTRTYARLLIQPVSIVNSSMWPELTFAFGQGDMVLVRRLYRFSLQISFTVGIVGAGIMIYAGPAFVRWWTNGRVSPDIMLVGVLCVTAACSLLWNSPQLILLAVNQLETIAFKYVIICALACLLCWIVCAQGFILAGVACLAMIDIAMGLITPRFANGVVWRTCKAA